MIPNKEYRSSIYKAVKLGCIATNEYWYVCEGTHTDDKTINRLTSVVYRRIFKKYKEVKQ